jgi:hypothetical protein
MMEVMVGDGTMDETKLEELGSIKVEIYPIIIRESRTNYKHRIEEETVYHPGKIHPLKAHSAKYNLLRILSNFRYVKQPYSGRERMYYKTERVHPKNPMATFIFKYRCRSKSEDKDGY